jgi:hypothetical protein
VDSNPEYRKKGLLFRLVPDFLQPNMHTEVKVHSCRFEWETKEETIKLATLWARKGKWNVRIYFRKENIQADYQKR